MIEVVYEVVGTLKGITNRFPLRSFSGIKAFVVQIKENDSNQNTAQSE